MINAEYKNAFLDEKNARNIMIHFVGTDEYISAEDIVDQGSFKYTESSNDGDEIKLGFSESSAFEIDLKGDYVDRTGQEIYVEVQAIVESDADVKIYPIPIGYFIISDVDYDYQNEKSHLLCYDKIAKKVGDNAILPPKIKYTNGFLLSNYYINQIMKLIPDDYYFEEKDVITIQKTLNPGIYTCKKDYYIRKSNTVYQTQLITQYKACEYIFDKSKAINNVLFFIIKSLHHFELRNNYDAYNAAENAIDAFWASNPNYDYNSMQYHQKAVSEKFDDLPEKRYILPFNTNIFRAIYPDEEYDYKLSSTSTTGIDGEYAFFLVDEFKSGYRSTSYNTYSSSDWREMPDNIPINWVYEGEKVDSADSFPEMMISYAKSSAYGNIVETLYGFPSASSYSDMTVSKFVSDFAEVQGQFAKVNRTNGEIETYSFIENSEIYPSNEIYPSENIFPAGRSRTVKISKSMYSSLVSKTKQSKKVGKVIVYKKDYYGNYQEYVAQVDDFDESRYSTITLSQGNFWIEQNFANAQDVANSILNMYKNNIYTPFELECTGLPWLEAGDWIAVETDEGQEMLNVNRRTLSGIQGMMDSLSAGGI